MENLLNVTEDEFYEKFKPIKNHLVEDCSFDGCMFETYGKELDYVKELIADGGEASVWTLEEVDGKMYIVSGYHFVNRLGYFITEEAVPKDVVYVVELDTEVDADDSNESGPHDQLGYEQTTEE